VGNTNRNGIEKQNKLEGVLTLAKREEELEPIFRAHEALGHHYMERGDFSSALAKFLDAKQGGGVGNGQKIQNAINISKAAINMKSYGQVKKQVDGAKRIPTLSENSVAFAQINACAGLYYLRESSYAAAANSFLNVTADIKDKFKDVISAEDVTNYACLCAMGSFSRRDLYRVLERDDFRKMLELRPIWSRIIQSYLASKYADTFQTLLALQNDFLLDIGMSSHWHRLLERIRERALVQYFKPFLSVKLSTMAKAFAIDIPALELQLAYLIGEGQIDARIDSANKVVYARNADQRQATFERASGVGTSYVRNLRSLLMRMSLVEGEFAVKPPESKKGKDDDRQPK